MIPRYSRPEMVDIWSPSTKFKIWYEIEAHACDAMAKIGVIPTENAEAEWKAKDIEFDESGNLWVANSYVTNKNTPIHVRDINGNWKSTALLKLQFK